MKQRDYLAHLHKLSPADMQKEIADLEKKLQAVKMAVAFGKSKQVRELRHYRRQLAQCLTLGNQKVRAVTAEAPQEK